jgi:putative ABC transport system permease protein
MSGWIQDLVRALRSFRRTPWFVAGLIFVLALGTGANAAIFSLVQAVLLRPLPYDRPDELVMVWSARNTPADWRESTTTESVLAWRESSPEVLRDLAVIKLWDGSREASIDLVLEDRAERLRAGIVTSNFFRVLGVSASLGRVFSPDDEAAGNLNLVVLADALWRRAFAADPAVVGRQLTLTTGDARERRPRSYLVIGVLPPTFKFTYPLDTELWTVDSWATIEASPRGSLAFNGAVGRLKPGVPLGVAAARMAHEEHGQVTRLEPISEWVIGEIRPSVLLLGVASLILLTITCATVAGALLVRLAQRQRELAVRASLGANRFRLAREALCEALALSVFGTAAGLMLALAVLPLFRALVPSIMPRANEIGINLWFALIAASVACVVTILSALLPALQASRIDIVQTLKRGSGTTSADRTTRRLRSALILTQASVATSLLVASLLLALSFWRLGRVDLGFDGNDVLTVEMRLREPRYFTPGAMRRLQDDLIARARAIPGVLDAGLTTAVPFRGTDWMRAVPRPGGGSRVFANSRMVDASFFSIMRIPLRRGRLFTSADTPDSPRVALVSESFGRQMFGEQDPLGRTFDMDGSVEVVGVVGDLRYVRHDQEAVPALYFARTQEPSELMCLILRTAPGVARTEASVRAAIRDVDPTLPPMNITTIDRIISESVADRRFYTTTTVAFAVLALLLTATALAIVIARAAVERRRELAIRGALGAPASHLRMLVARQGVIPVGFGVAAGLTAAWYGTTMLQRFLFQVEAQEPIVYGVAGAVAIVVAILSSILPTRTVGNLPPAVVLRGD